MSRKTKALTVAERRLDQATGLLFGTGTALINTIGAFDGKAGGNPQLTDDKKRVRFTYSDVTLEVDAANQVMILAGRGKSADVISSESYSYENGIISDAVNGRILAVATAAERVNAGLPNPLVGTINVLAPAS